MNTEDMAQDTAQDYSEMTLEELFTAADEIGVRYQDDLSDECVDMTLEELLAELEGE